MNKIGKNVKIEKGAIVGAQPFTFTEKGELDIPEYGVVVKDNVWVGANSLIMCGHERDTYIGKNVKVAPLCAVGHDSIIEDGVLISVGTIIGGHVRIGKGSIIYMGVRIRNRVKIGKGSIIGMGSNVVSDIPDNVIAYGNPCKVISKRESTLKHYARMLLR